MSKRHPLDDAFQNKLRDFSMPVPPELWQNIEGKLSRKRYPIWLPWIMGTAAIATLALVGYLLLSSDENSIDKIDRSSEPTADANIPQVIDNETDIYAAKELSNINKTTDPSSEASVMGNERTSSNGDAINPGNSGERTQNSDRITQNEDGSTITAAGKKKINRINDAKEVLGLSKPDGTELDESVKTPSYINVEEQPQVDESKKGRITRPNRIAEERVSDATKSTVSGRALMAKKFAIPALLKNDISTHYILSEEASMGLPKLRKLRDRNCEDEHFSPGNIFLEFSYGLHHGNLNFGATDEIFSSYEGLRSKGEAFSFSRQYQGLIAFQVGRRSYFKTGISLNIVESDYYFVDQVNKRTIRDSIWNEGTMEYDVTEREADIYIDGVNRYTFIDIPLLFSYGWQFNKVGLNLTTGPLVNISFMREGKLPSRIGQGIDLEDGLWNDRDIYRKTAGLSWFLSTQISYQAYRNVDIYVEPRIISGLNSITLENDGTEVDLSKTSYPLSQRMFQYGIGAGLRFSLNNN